MPKSFRIQQLETPSQKQKEQIQKQLGADKLVTTQIWKLKNVMYLFFSDVFSLPVHFEYYAIFESWIFKKTYLLEKDLNNVSMSMCLFSNLEI